MNRIDKRERFKKINFYNLELNKPKFILKEVIKQMKLHPGISMKCQDKIIYLIMMQKVI